MNEIIAAFRALDLDPGHIILDGKIHRFKVDSSDTKNSGWYVGFQNHTSKGGQIFQVVVFGNYQVSREALGKYQTDTVQLNAHDKKVVKDQIAKAKREADEARERLHAEVANEVTELFDKASSTGTSQYLEKKKIADVQNLGVKFDGGNLLVPMRDVDGKLWSIQRINWDGGKWFHAGGRVRGCFHTIGDPARNSIVYICEGFATGASIHHATGIAAVVAFNAQNLITVAVAFKKVHPDIAIVICGDDDRWKDPSKNPGREAAEEAATKSLGRAAFPQFADTSSKPTDFNDLHVAEGIDAVREQLEAIEVKPLALFALGFNDNSYFFTSTENRQIVAVANFSERDFLNLMPLSYWEAVFPGRSENTRVDWTLARSELMAQARKKGIFHERAVRGSGVWNDDGRTVVHLGDHLLVDSRREELGSFKSRYFYPLGRTLNRLHHSPLSAKECKPLVEACQLFKWKRAEDGMLLAGALVCSRICGALPVRPHTWITGGALTGKTTLLKSLVRPIMGSASLYVQGATTEAGVRQSLRADAIPVLFDEFETTGRGGDENLARLIELMRASWSDSEAVIIKGSAGGTASAFQVRFSAIVSSIRTKLVNDADKGRFAVIELAPHGSDHEHWKNLSAALAQIDEEFSERLFARTIAMLPVILQNYRTIKKALAQKADARFGDQYGMILAGYATLLQDEAVSVEDAEWLAGELDLENEREQAKQADHSDALNHLLTTVIQVESMSGRMSINVGEAIRLVHRSGKSQVGHDAERRALTNLGIRVDSDRVAIATPNHAHLESEVFRGTRWSESWSTPFARLEGAMRDSVRIGGSMKRCVWIPIVHFDL